MLTAIGPQRARVEYHRPSALQQVQVIRVALAGCGVVGGSFVRLLEASSEALFAQHGLRVEIATVLVRDTARERGLEIENGLFTDDLETFLSIPVDVVIEAIGGKEPAGTIASVALGRANRFITANKELVSDQGPSLDKLAFDNGAQFDFDAAVGGGAPVLRTLRDATATARPSSLRGILNGTSNFVLTELERGESFDTAIARARARGLAEDDYSRDLDGRDAAAKIAIIAWRTFGVNPSTIPVQRIGLLPDVSGFVRHASRLDASVRLVAECAVLDDSRITVSVLPTIVARASALGRTVKEENRIELELGWSAPLSITAPGAGGAPTATALLSDLLNVRGRPSKRDDVDGGSYSAVIDPRPHRWLVAATASVPDMVQAFGSHAPHSLEHDVSTGETTVITGSITFADVEVVVSRLKIADPNVIAARIDLPIFSGIVQ